MWLVASVLCSDSAERCVLAWVCTVEPLLSLAEMGTRGVCCVILQAVQYEPITAAGIAARSQYSFVFNKLNCYFVFETQVGARVWSFCTALGYVKNPDKIQLGVSYCSVALI
jgi:hypothetical protein